MEGDITINDVEVSTHRMAVLPDQDTIAVRANSGARIALFGGEPLGKRYVWWNFVASSPKRIREAAKLWEEGGFDRVEGDDEFIPLPENRPMPE